MKQPFPIAPGLHLLVPLALAGLAAGVFFPVAGYEFVDLDVEQQLLDNPDVHGLSLHNIKRIFTTRSITSYYPVRSLSYAVDYELWGLWPGGFKLTNLLIHTLNVLLLYWLVLRFAAHPACAGLWEGGWRGQLAAGFSAALLAVHPVVVEPVVWVAGREELLMTLGALGCLHFHLTARRLGARRAAVGWVVASYAGAALCCAVACLSNVAGAVVPALVTVWDALTLVRPTVWRILPATAALWAMGIAAVVIKKVGEVVDAASQEAVFSVRRLALALEVYGLNLKTLVWPSDLSAFRVNAAPDSLAEPAVLAGAAAALGTGVLLWAVRRRRLLLFGLLWFLIAYAPSSQLMAHHIYRADRFLYLPLGGLAVALAALGVRVAHRRPVGLAALSIVAALGVVAGFQLRTWRNALTMWEHCLRVDPSNGVAHLFYADHLVERGEYERAIRHYEQAIQIRLTAAMARSQLALLLATCPEESIRDYRRAIKLATAAWQESPRFIRTATGVWARQAEDQARRGQFAAAIASYRKALEIHPANRPALLELADLLTSCPDRSLRNPQEAVQLAERALRVRATVTADDLRILAAAYAATGRFQEAEATATQAVRTAEKAGQRKLARQLRAKKEEYRRRISGRPP